MNLDWGHIARDLAAHLVAATDVEIAERILRDAQQDAARLVAPPEFWSRVANEYETQSRRHGVEANDHVRGALARFRDGS
jgi:hypothetical protein